LLALGRVAEDLLGLVELLEASLGCGVARLGVRVMLAGQLAERLLDLSLRRRPRDTEDGVVVLEVES
jgi:hypothetical protein